MTAARSSSEPQVVPEPGVRAGLPRRALVREAERLVVVHARDQVVVGGELELAEAGDGPGRGAAHDHRALGLDLADRAQRDGEERVPLRRGEARLVEEVVGERPRRGGEPRGDPAPQREEPLGVRTHAVGVVHGQHDAEPARPDGVDELGGGVEEPPRVGVRPPAHRQPHRGEARGGDVIEVLAAHLPAVAAVTAVEDAAQVDAALVHSGQRIGLSDPPALPMT